MVIVEYKGDQEALRPLVERWRDEANNGPYQMALDVGWFLEHLTSLLWEDAVLLILESDEGQPLGLMGLCVLASPLSGEPTLNEHMWYVLPEHRSMSVTRKILDRAYEWGLSGGCKHFLLTASHLANVDMERVSKLYGRLGFVPFENVFMRRINGE